MPILGIHLAHLIDYALTRGVPARTLPVPPVDLLAAHTTVDAATYRGVLQALDDTLQDPLLGLRYGQYQNLQALGLIYQISMNVSSFGEALHYLSDYVAATFPLVQLSIQRQGGALVVRLLPRDTKPPFATLDHHLLETLLVVMYRESHAMTGGRHAIRFTCPGPPSPDHIRAFAGHVEQGDGYAMHVKDTLITARLDPLRQLHLERLIPKFVEMIDRTRQAPDTLQHRVRRTLLNLATPELPPVDQTARVLNMSTRTLQRRLRAEQTTYRKMLEDVRKELATYFLLNQKLSVQQIAMVLGYAEPASFIHAFKRWTAQTPHQMKRALQQA